MSILLFLLGATLLTATYYAIRKNGEITIDKVVKKAPMAVARIDQAFEFRQLFEAGIISKTEYERAVASLYPEINRLL